MKKLYFLIPVIALTFSCSESDENIQQCSSDLAGIQVTSNTLYTGEIVTLGTVSLCASDQLAVYVNDKVVETTTDDNGIISFVMPNISETTATVKLTAGSEEVVLTPKDVVKAAGAWKEVASFPANGRSFTVNFSTPSDGFLYGGHQEALDIYLDYADLFRYNPEENVWTKLSTNDAFKQGSQAIVGNKLFLEGKTYSVDQNSFDPISYINNTEGELSTQYFTCNNTVYAISNIQNSAIEIQKYNSESNTWTRVKLMDYDVDAYISFGFAVEQNGKTYIDVRGTNSRTREVWAFNGADNSFSKVSSVTNDTEGGSHGLQHLFTLNGLGYFIETGEASVDYDGKITIIKPHSKFYVYNFANSEWHKVQTEFPAPMYGASAFNVGNRGFAGLGSTEGATTGFVYTQNFFEFVPAK